MSQCPSCHGPLNPQSAGFTENGLVCELCVLDEVDRDRAQLALASGEKDRGGGIGVNAVGIGLLALTGVGFTSRGRAPTKAEMEAQLRHQRAQRRQAAARRPISPVGIFLKRGEDQVGPYSSEQLAEMWSDGLIEASDEFWYEGMPEWRVVTEFAPPV